MTYRLGSVCTGFGGLDEAVMELTGAELAWVADNDPDVCKLLAVRYPGIPNLGDITKADWDAVEKVDILVGGTPCQDISCAGQRVGMLPGNRSGLWSWFAYAVSKIRPPLVIWENVRGATSAKAHSDVELCPVCLGEAGVRPLRALGAVLGELSALGYDADWCNIRASDAGSCHARERIFLIAYPPVANPGGKLQREHPGEPPGEEAGPLSGN